MYSFAGGSRFGSACSNNSMRSLSVRIFDSGIDGCTAMHEFDSESSRHSLQLYQSPIGQFSGIRTLSIRRAACSLAVTLVRSRGGFYTMGRRPGSVLS